MVFKGKKPPARRPSRKGRKRPANKKGKSMTKSQVQDIALNVVNKGREIKRTYGSISLDADNNEVGVPTGS